MDMHKHTFMHTPQTDTAVHRQTLQYTDRHCSTQTDTAVHRQALQYTDRHCSTQTDTAVHRQALQYTDRHCSTQTDTACIPCSLCLSRFHFTDLLKSQREVVAMGDHFNQQWSNETLKPTHFKGTYRSMSLPSMLAL
jgi:hypothetical protein